MAREELQVVDRTYELLKWFLGHLAKFPRHHRYSLGVAMENRLQTILTFTIGGEVFEGKGGGAACGQPAAESTLRGRVGS